MHIQESGQMYLETIYVLSSKKSVVRAIDVGEHMGYSKPSVSRAMGILKKEELISIDKNGHITLTEKGLDFLENYVREVREVIGYEVLRPVKRK